MKSVYKSFWAGCMTLFLCAAANGHPTTGTKTDFTQTIKRLFDAPSGVTVEVDNKYGAIAVESWDKKQVEIEARIVVSANSESEARPVFDRIQVHFKVVGNTITAATGIGEESSSSWWNAFGVSSSSKTEFRIHYRIRLPKSGSVRLTNKYDDILIGALHGDAELNLDYGSFNLQSARNVTLRLNFATGTLGTAQNLDAEISNANHCRLQSVETGYLFTNNSRLTIGQAGNLNIDARNDAFAIGAVQKLNFQGRYADLDVRRLAEGNLSGRYSDIRIRNLDEAANLDLQFGSVKIDHLSRDFSNLTLNGQYTDLQIKTDAETGFALFAEGNFSNIEYPARFRVSEESKNGARHTLNGYLGKGTPKGKVVVRMKQGELRIE